MDHRLYNLLNLKYFKCIWKKEIEKIQTWNTAIKIRSKKMIIDTLGTMSRRSAWIAVCVIYI